MNDDAKILVKSDVYCTFDDMIEYDEVKGDLLANSKNYWCKPIQDDTGILEELGYNYCNGELVAVWIWDNTLKPKLEKMCSAVKILEDNDYYDRLMCVINDTSNMEDEPIEPLEYYIISDRLYRLLMDEGECVSKIGTMHIWLRTTSGQAIYADTVIQKIYNESFEK